MQSKLKECAGWDGNSHSAYIYKNINGKKYCKICSFRLQPAKSIPRRRDGSKITQENKKRKIEEQFKMFLEIWQERQHSDGYNYCEVSGKRLSKEPTSLMFDHLLEKSVYPEYRFDKRNIIIVDVDVHSLKTAGFPLPKHKELIEAFKQLISP